jgi:hypothetical protein
MKTRWTTDAVLITDVEGERWELSTSAMGPEVQGTLGVQCGCVGRLSWDSWDVKVALGPSIVTGVPG